MKYHILAAHRETAVDVEVLVEAETEGDATEVANSMQLMVERIEPVQTSLALGDAQWYEYHTLRCDFRDLAVHLTKYGKEGWRLLASHHDPNDDKMVRCVMERPQSR